MLVQPKPVSSASSREFYLDGLRGIAALIVVVYHFLSAYVAHWIPDQTTTPIWVADTPLGILYNGPFSVAIFFVLSGYVVSNSAAKKRDPIPVNLLVRYLRLALPATASILYACALLHLMPDASVRLMQLMPHSWLTDCYHGKGYIPGLFSALKDGLVGEFKHGYSNFNNVLWTMKIELIGSVGIYILYGLSQPKQRWIILPILGAALLLLHRALPYEGFVLGCLLLEARKTGKLPTNFVAPALIIGIILGSEATGFAQRMHLHHMPQALTLGDKNSLFYPLAAALIVYACLISPQLKAMLSSRIPRFLGRISFSLYLVHVPLLYTVFAIACASIWPFSTLEILGLLLVFVATSLVLGYIFTLAVDEPVLKLNSWIRAKLNPQKVFRLA